MSESTSNNVRALAAQILTPVINQKGSLNLSGNLATSEQALLRELCFGTLRMYPRLNAQLEKLLTKGLKAKDSDVRSLMLIGLYQLQHMRIPDHAVLHQTVSATQALGKNWARGLTNAVLRNAQRQKESLNEKLAGQPAFELAHPQWLCEALQKAWPKQFEQIIDAGNQYPPMCIRVNTQKTSSALYSEMLSQAEIEHQPCVLSPVGIRLEKPTAVGQLPGFHQGYSSVQDEAAQLCAPLLKLGKGQRVLDACAAPGGKTAHLLETEPGIDLLAMDISENRLADVASNLERLGLAAELKAADAADTQSWWGGKPFDRILLDAPCSGTGVIRRHPDIKILRHPKDIDSFKQQQQRLLDNLWPLLAEDGLLLYVTCSIMPDENETQITAFVKRHNNIEVLPVKENIGVKQTFGRQLLPSIDGPDGFYFALLRKTS